MPNLPLGVAGCTGFIDRRLGQHQWNCAPNRSCETRNNILKLRDGMHENPNEKNCRRPGTLMELDHGVQRGAEPGDAAIVEVRKRFRREESAYTLAQRRPLQPGRA